MSREWAEIEAWLRDDAYQSITSQPEFLFEHDGGPYGIAADLIYARLVGFDDQIVTDWKLDSIKPELFMPIPEQVAWGESEATLRPTFRAAKFVLQSGWATLEIQPLMYCNDGPVPEPPDFLTRMLFLRYKRRA